MKLSSFFIILFFSIRSIGQPATSKAITGLVKDINHETVGGATVRLLRFKDSSVISGGITSETGKFSLKSPGYGSYLVTVSGTGFRTYFSVPLVIDALQAVHDLPIIVLFPSKGVDLKGVRVVSKRPLLEQDIDRTIVNVDAMISAASSNTLEVLQKTPGVTVDNDGSISLNGKSGMLVLIDGRPTYMGGQDLAAYLKSLPGAVVDKIELMDNPPSKYDAAGSAVINIRLKKSKKSGLTGNVSTGFSSGRITRSYNTVSINYNRKKINAFGNIGYSTDGNDAVDFYDRQFYNNAGNFVSRILIDNNGHYKSQAMSSRGGLDFSVSPKTVFGMQFNVQTRPGRENTYYESRYYSDLLMPDSINNGSSKSVSGWNTKGLNLNFQHKLTDKGKELSGDFNYIRYNSSGMPVYYNFSNTQNTGHFKNDIKSGIDIYSFKTDYVQPLKKGAMIEAGIKSGLVTYDNDSRYSGYSGNDPVQDFSKSNHFLYKENINAAYFNLRKNWKRIGGQAGLRLENTRLKGNLLANPAVSGRLFHQSFTDIFPSIFLSYKLDSLNKNTITISAGSRINRPNYQQLNPFLVYRDKFSYTQGNPDLQPQYMSRMELRYQFKQVLSVGISYNRAANLASQANEARGDTFVLRPINIAKGRMVLLTTNLTLNPRKWWNVNVNLQAAYFKLMGAAFTEKINNGIPASRISITNQFNLKKGLAGELSGYFTSKDIVGQVYLKSRYRVWAAIQKKVLKDKGSIKLSLEDIFHSWIQVENSFAIKQSEFYHRNENDTQRFGLAFSYRFGSEKFLRKRKPVENAADSEKGRVEQ